MRKQYTGGARATALATGINSGSTTFQVEDGANYPAGGTEPFVVTVGRGTSAEEKILISSRSGNVFTIATGGRGYDSSSEYDHAIGDVVEHTIDAESIDRLADHTFNTALDDHAQYLNVARHAADHVTNPHSHANHAGLDGDDHPQYLLTDGTRTPIGDITFGGYKATLLGDPTLATDGANKGYVDGEISALNTGLTADLDQFKDDIKTQHGALIVRSSNRSVPTGTNLVLEFPSGTSQTGAWQISDGAAWWDAGSNTRLTVPGEYDGRWAMIGAYVSWQNASGGRRMISLLRNGNPFIKNDQGVSGGSYFYNQSILSGPIQIYSGNYFQLEVYHTQGSNIDVNGGTSIYGSSGQVTRFWLYVL